jgi:hypothetical protein
MSVQIAQTRIKDVHAAVKKMFAAIYAVRPEGIRYASCLLPDGETFVALAQVDHAMENPLGGLPRIPGAPRRRRGLAYRAAQRSTVDGHRLVPLVLRATESPCFGRKLIATHLQ